MWHVMGGRKELNLNLSSRSLLVDESGRLVARLNGKQGSGWQLDSSYAGLPGDTQSLGSETGSLGSKHWKGFERFESESIVLLMGTLRFRDEKWLAQDHTDYPSRRYVSSDSIRNCNVIIVSLRILFYALTSSFLIILSLDAHDNPVS